VRHARWVVAATLLATAFFLSRIVDPTSGELRLRVDPSTDRLLAEGDSRQERLERVSTLFGQRESLLVALETDDVYTPENLAAIARTSRALEDLPFVHEVLSLDTALNMRSFEGAIEIEPFLERIPETVEGLARLRADVERNPLYAGRLVSNDAQMTSIVLALKDIPLDRLIDESLDLQVEQVARENAPHMKVRLTGAPHIKATTSRLLFEGLGRILPISFVIMGVLGALAFRSIRGVLAPMATVVLTTIWTLGIVAWRGVSLNLVTSIVPPLLVTIAAAYALHVVSEFYRTVGAGEANFKGVDGPVARAIGHVALPVALTGLTTAAGLLALTMSPFQAVREFGLIAVLGVVIAALISLTFVPAMLTLGGAPERMPARRDGEPGSTGGLDRLLSTLGRFDVRYRKAILVCGVGLGVVAVVGMDRITLNSDLVSNFSSDHPVRANFEAINQRLEGAIPIFLVIESDEPDAFVKSQNLRAVDELVQWVAAQPGVGGTTSLVDYVKTLNRVLRDDEDAAFRIPDESVRYVKQILLFGAGEGLRSVVDSSYRTTNVHIRTQAMNTRDMAELVARIEARLETLPTTLRGEVMGNMVLLTRSLDDAAQGQIETLGVAFVFIFVILFALFASARVALFALVPNVLPVVVYFGTLGLTGIPLNTTTGLFACIVLGIAVDDTIHFLTRFNREARERADEKRGAVEALREVGRPVTITTIGLCMGFAVIATSELKNQVEFGLLGAFTLAIAWLVDVTFTPALCAGMRVVNLWDILTLDLGRAPQQTVPVLRGLNNAQAKIAALMSSVETFEPGQPIYRVGDPGDGLYVVLDGEFSVSIAGDAGEKLELSRCQRGDVVGEVALYHGTRTADVDAVTPSRALRFDSDALERLRARYPRIGARVLRNLSEVLASRLATATLRVG
jgi:predicted RND superfamily exporter protein